MISYPAFEYGVDFYTPVLNLAGSLTNNHGFDNKKAITKFSGIDLFSFPGEGYNLKNGFAFNFSCHECNEQVFSEGLRSRLFFLVY